ncbi:transcriptional regulator GlxA family with amidase domain [Agromyces ramosus]|uniref:Transcriptional regulator GlxA family with amidase domain n=2 Tax=Agromyces ramosus TaxID=33879 RepID=A0ABU0RAA7_9MICO|nr:transcriptional regulator GlxA family with amidase domain [Agromyces ramosus]
MMVPMTALPTPISSHRSRRIGFLLFDGVKALDYVGPAEVFIEANQAVDAYDVVLLSPTGADVMTSLGGRVSVHASAADVADLDTLVVPGSEERPSAFARGELLDAAAALAERSRRVVSICSGAFVLAALGVLDGRSATTHWKFAADLARHYPRIDVQADRIFVRDGEVATSAGVAAGIDLALALVEDDHGPDVARRVAQGLLVYLQRSGGQSQFSTPLRARAPQESVVRKVTDLLEADPAAMHTVADLARHANVSMRHLTRLFREELDTSPAEYLAALRFDLARCRLEAGTSVAQTAIDAGFSSAESLRRSFVARLGISPSQYQRRFRSADGGATHPTLRPAESRPTVAGWDGAAARTA